MHYPRNCRVTGAVAEIQKVQTNSTGESKGDRYPGGFAIAVNMWVLGGIKGGLINKEKVGGCICGG